MNDNSHSFTQPNTETYVVNVPIFNKPFESNIASVTTSTLPTLFSRHYHFRLSLKYNPQLRPSEPLLRQIRVIRHHRIGTLHIRIIIQPPIRGPDLPGRMK